MFLGDNFGGAVFWRSERIKECGENILVEKSPTRGCVTIAPFKSALKLSLSATGRRMSRAAGTGSVPVLSLSDSLIPLQKHIYHTGTNCVELWKSGSWVGLKLSPFSQDRPSHIVSSVRSLWPLVTCSFTLDEQQWSQKGSWMKRHFD